MRVVKNPTKSGNMRSLGCSVLFEKNLSSLLRDFFLRVIRSPQGESGREGLIVNDLKDSLNEHRGTIDVNLGRAVDLH